jgi:hypothetical protein
MLQARRRPNWRPHRRWRPLLRLFSLIFDNAPHPPDPEALSGRKDLVDDRDAGDSRWVNK